MKATRLPLSAVLLVFFACGHAAFSYSPSMVAEHDWTLEVGDYTFGVIQWAPVSLSPPWEPAMEQAIFSRRTSMYIGSWSADVPMSALALVGVLVVPIALGAGAICVLWRRRHRKGVARS